MTTIITLITLLLASPGDATALCKTAPSYLTIETASTHLVAARIAAATYAVDVDLLLSTAYYESRYTVNVVGPTVRGKVACGVMQPTMEMKCAEAPTLLNGYLEGAKHYRDWYDACRGNERCAILGYGGGYALIKKCAEGPLNVERRGKTFDLCTLPDVRLGRARWIKRLRSRGNNT
jgi:hypothetical protein